MMDVAAPASSADRSTIERRRRLSEAALAVAQQKVPPAYSPVVIAGAVRLADFMLLNLAGIGTGLHISQLPAWTAA